jgi:hypothetical protein
MDRELAKHVVISAFRSMRELTDLLEMLKEHCEATEYDSYLRGIGDVCAHIGTDLIDKAMAGHPDLKSELEAKMKKYQKFI